MTTDHTNVHMESLDVYTFGEAMLRLSVPPGDRLRLAPTFDVHIGGAESNVAIALARLGRRVGWGSCLPRTELGQRVAETIAAAGVDVSSVRWVDDGRVGSYFVELRSAPSAPMVIYDRAGSTAASLTEADLDSHAIDTARWVHLTGITPALSSSCASAAERVTRRVRERHGRVCLDVNYRARLWSPEDARRSLDGLAVSADLVLCSSEDAAHVFGCTGAPAAVVERLAERWSGTRVVLTTGADGVVWFDGGVVDAAEGLPTPYIVDRIGAGDALAAGVLHGMLDDDLGHGVRIGIAMASITLGTRGDAFPGSLPEAAALVAPRSRRVDR